MKRVRIKISRKMRIYGEEFGETVEVQTRFLLYPFWTTVIRFPKNMKGFGDTELVSQYIAKRLEEFHRPKTAIVRFIDRIVGKVI